MEYHFAIAMAAPWTCMVAYSFFELFYNDDGEAWLVILGSALLALGFGLIGWELSELELIQQLGVWILLNGVSMIYAYKVGDEDSE